MKTSINVNKYIIVNDSYPQKWYNFKWLILHTKDYSNYKRPVPYIKYLKIYDMKLIGHEHICWVTQPEEEKKEHQPLDQNH